MNEMVLDSNRIKNEEVGFVTRAKGYLLALEGLPSIKVNDFLVDEQGNYAMVRSLGHDQVVALSFGGQVRPGDRYRALRDNRHYSLGEHLFGRVMNALGDPVDGGELFPEGNASLKLEVDATGIEGRVSIDKQLQTGITLVDTLVPIAKGQRQLIYGPMHSGKSTFLTDLVLHQGTQDVVCIYTVIGKPINGLRKITDTILGKGYSGQKVVVIAGLSDEPAPVISLVPAVAYLVAEYFSARGEDVLIVLDDLDAHAKYLREIALLEGRLPSTESYPGDIFYQHAHLMERSGQFDSVLGGGSITTLPVIQTNLKNFSDLIPTNLMACTDGHLSFLPDMRAEGVYPSIGYEESVTRVGRRSQCRLQKEISTRVQILLGEYRQQQEYAEFSSTLSEYTKKLLKQGDILKVMLRQEPYQPISLEAQMILLGLAFTSFAISYDPARLEKAKSALQVAVSGSEQFKSLREIVFTDIGLDEFVSKLESLQTYFDSVCQP